MIPEYDDSEWTADEMLLLAARAFDDAENAGPIPSEPISSTDDIEVLIQPASKPPI